MPRTAIILNPVSGQQAARHDQLKALLDASQMRAAIFTPQSPSEVAALARQLVQEGYDIIAAAGGDGTVSAVASALAGTPAALAILPLGTLNHLAKDLRIPFNLSLALDTIHQGYTTTIDIGEVNGQPFVNNISLGAYPALVEERGNYHRRRPRLVRWIITMDAFIKVLAKLPRLFVRVEVDGRPMTRITPLIFVGNNDYRIDEPGAGTRAALDKGRLSIIISRRKGPWGLLRLAIRAALGTLRGHRDLDEFLATTIDIHTPRHTLPVGIDGEVRTMHAPLHCTIRPGALRVIVPRPQQQAA